MEDSRAQSQSNMAAYQSVNQISGTEARETLANSQSQKSASLPKNVNLETQPGPGQQEAAPGLQMFEAASSSSLVQDNKEVLQGMGLNVQAFEHMGDTYDKLRWAFQQK